MRVYLNGGNTSFAIGVHLQLRFALFVLFCRETSNIASQREGDDFLDRVFL